jgi:hypothetical protein
MTGRPAPPWLDWSSVGVIDRLALALFPWLEGEPCEPCLRVPADPEPEAGL